MLPWTVTARCTHPKSLSHIDKNRSRIAAFPQKTDRVTLPSFPRILLSRHCTVVFAGSEKASQNVNHAYMLTSSQKLSFSNHLLYRPSGKTRLVRILLPLPILVQDETSTMFSFSTGKTWRAVFSKASIASTLSHIRRGGGKGSSISN